ncbi:TetR/AcrR family transcriptional regulator [Sunxiuqinia sp. A32]|uniref:TetR/AcrR family transcriptional regulator n=1 Tax=Sunxiuqinia sp. A32 TaxID=3461496 RepID=UPI0040458C8B
MPRTEEQFEQIRKEKKELIRQTALELFAEYGYHGTSISQIAKKASISKGLTYNYYESKSNILQDIISNGFEVFFGNIDLNHDGVLSDEEFFAFIRKSFEIVKRNPRYWKLFYSLMLQPVVAESLMDSYAEQTKPIMEMMFQYIVNKGSADPEGDLIAINSMLEGAMMYAVLTPDMFPIDVMIEKIINTIKRILETNKASKS